MTVRRHFAPLYAGRPYGVRAHAVRSARLRDVLAAAARAALRSRGPAGRQSLVVARARARRVVDRRASPAIVPRTRTGRSTSWFRIRSSRRRSARRRPSSWTARRRALCARRLAAAGATPVALRIDGRLCGAARRRELAAQALAARALARARRCAGAARHRVVWTAGPGEAPLLDAIGATGAAPAHRRHALARRALASACACARCSCAPDTGVAHLGRVVGVPTVTLFGPGSAVICGAGRFLRGHARTAP